MEYFAVGILLIYRVLNLLFAAY